jgi:serine/threonine-protein kinase
VARDVFGIVGTTQAQSFKIERVVAEGGFGVVYKAHHVSFRAPVALKCLKVPETMSDEARAHFFERFRAEGELLFRLSQAIPQVVRPLHVDVIDLGGRLVPFLALEWLEGETLDRVVARRSAAGAAPLGLYQSVKLLAPIAQALARAHRFRGPRGVECVVHRDLKPENIFLAKIGGDEVPKILDFGIARAKSDAAYEAGRVTDGDGLSSFTPGYAAPEQWLPKRYGQPGPWTDVYGLAMTLVELVTGRPPIDGDLASMMATTVDPERRPTPRAEGVVISDEAEAAFTLALAIDPRVRAQTVERFWTPLEKALGMPPTLLPGDAADKDVEIASADLVEVEGPGTREKGFGVLTIDLPVPDAPPPSEARPRGKVGVGATLPEAGAISSAAIPDLDAPAPARPRRAAIEAPPEPVPTSSEFPHGPDRHRVSARPAPRPVPMPSRPRPYVPVTTPEPGVYERLRPGLFYIGLAIVIVIGDAGYTFATNETVSVAGFRPPWLAGPLLAIGIGVAAWRLLASHD